MTWEPQTIGVVDAHGRLVCATCMGIEGVSGETAFSGSGCWDSACRYCGMVMEVPLLKKDFSAEEPATKAHVSEVLTSWARAAAGRVS